MTRKSQGRKAMENGKRAGAPGGIVWNWISGAFCDEILSDESPPKIPPLTFFYDGSTNPWEHLLRFENLDLLYRHSDAVKCKLFLTTLTETALRWFESLPPRSINNFEDFSLDFLKHFRIRIPIHSKPASSLWGLRQKEGESPWSYIQRFGTEALEVRGVDQEILYNSIVDGLREGEFTKAMDKDPPGSLVELLIAAEKYTIAEEVQKMKECSEAETTKGKKRKRKNKKKKKKLVDGLRGGEFTKAMDKDPPGCLLIAADKYSIAEEVQKLKECFEAETTKGKKRKRENKKKLVEEEEVAEN